MELTNIICSSIIGFIIGSFLMYVFDFFQCKHKEPKPLNRCTCYTCQNKDNKDRLHGYYTCERQHSKVIIDTLTKSGIKPNLLGNELEKLLMTAKYNYDTAGLFIEEIEKE